MNAEKPTREHVVEVVEELLDDLKSERTLLARKGKDPATLRAVVPLYIHASRTAGAVLELEQKGAKFEILPLVRATFETGVTAQWIAHFPDGLKALANEQVRQRKNLIDAALQSDFREAGREAKELDKQRDQAPFDSSSNESAKHFEQMCLDFRGGENLYALYRLMSGLAHPSLHVVDLYLDAEAPEDSWPGVLGEPRDFDSVIWLHLTATALIWAARAVTYFDSDTSRRDHHRRVARRIQIADQLSPSDRSWLKRIKKKVK